MRVGCFIWSRFVVTPASHELLPIFIFGSRYGFQHLCPAVRGMTGKSDYCILVSAVGDSAQRTLRERPEADLYGFNLQDRIPVFLLPLSNEDSPIPVDLGILLQTVYEEGCFDLQIDYHQSVPEPSLTIQNAEWVKKILQAL
jgi:Protein of unknown function (DUF4058)